MQCPFCKEIGQRSRVFEDGPSSSTLVYAGREWDEDGNEVTRDPNVTTTPYRCDHGHHWCQRSDGVIL